MARFEPMDAYRSYSAAWHELDAAPREARQDGRPVYTGTDFVEFDDEGRISRLTMFTDSGPLP